MFDIGRPDAVQQKFEWHTHSLKAGQAVIGRLVGPIVCPQCHWSGAATIPCVKVMTNGAIPCSCDECPRPTRKVGYVPTLLTTGERWVIIVSNGVALQLIDKPHRTLIRFTRTRVPKSPLQVVVANDWEGPTDFMRRTARYPEQDIRAYLLHLWGIEALTRWCKARENVNRAVDNLVAETISARDTIAQPSPAPVSGATELRSRLRRARASTG